MQRTIADLHGACADLLACDPALIPGEHRLLSMFAELSALSRARQREDDADAELLHSPQEHLHLWLRSLDVEAEGLPESFVAQLRRALGHYGIDGLERTPALEVACHRLFLAQQRAPAARAAIIATLDRRLEDADQLAGHVGEDFREILDRLVVALEGQDQIVADLAREVRFSYFDERVIAAARERVYAEICAATGGPRRRSAAPRARPADRLAGRVPAAAGDDAHRADAKRPAGVPASAGRGDGAPLLSRALAAGLRGARPRRPRFLVGRYEFQEHVPGARRELRRARGRRRGSEPRSPSTPRRCQTASSRCSTCTRSMASRRPDVISLPRACGRRSRSSARRRRCTGS